ncbi:hypothetical protein [Chitinophaga sp. sic0106]|uniref:hypothetical protein n=1 Tax=Chitinophaga sp. sic0106 TaxID=2854785 RepID=UPI001C47CB64|nr:hypothetical protein [Chitinophaga sp. sic0106]MBV7528531.1 hypothetical protein [Chitinophaga sp. sic0106]
MKNIILALLLVAGMLPAYAQVINTNSDTDSSTVTYISKLLILSTGTLSSRKIAQDLQYALDKKYKHAGFSSTFVHLGKFQNGEPISIQAAAKTHPHDAILLITPNLVRDCTIVYVRNNMAIGGNRNTENLYPNEYSHQQSTFHLMYDADPNRPIRQFPLDISTNLASKKYFNKLADTLVKKLNSHLIVLGNSI